MTSKDNTIDSKYNYTYPLISIVTVVFNGDKYIEETIKSVRNQSYENIEYIIIDGGSTDHTLDIIQKYNDSIDCWITEKDKGIYDAMNKGIDICSGSWFHFLNAGDVYVTEDSLKSVIKLYTQYASKDVNFIYSKYVNGKANEQHLSYRYLIRNMINHQTIIYGRELLKNNYFRINYSITADYEHLLGNYNKIVPFRHDIDFVRYDRSGISSDRENISKIWNERALAGLRTGIENKSIWGILIFFVAKAASIIRGINK